MVLRYTLAWIPMVAIAIVNGALREGTYGKSMTELRAHQVSTLTGFLLMGIYMGAVSYAWPLASAGEAAAVGLIWLALTVAFEFLFGHYVAGHTWSRLFRDYNLLAGRVWVLMLVWVAVAPLFFWLLR